MTQPANTAARRLVETLIINGIDRVFCVPGESYLAVLDALADVRDKIQVIACRHEAGAANMAEAYGKLTGRPGVCMVTRGPGATHASIGVHTAHQDSTPMILFVGQIALTDRGRGAFQEVDYREVFGGLAKWATEIESPERTVEVVERAFATALQGRMGPAVIALPEDILHADGGPAPIRPVTPAKAALAPDVLADIGARLAKAERPLIVVGGSGWTDAAAAALADWAERCMIPISGSFRRKDIVGNDRRNYAGDLGLGCNPKLVARARAADLIIAIGARLGENPTQGYTLFDRAHTAQVLVHLHPGAEELGRVWPTLVAGVADNSLAARALATLEPGRTWEAEARAAHDDYLAFSTPVPVTGAVNMSECMAHLAEALPPTAIITNGAGNFAAWLHRFYRHRACRTQLAPTSGAMGYGYPAAIAAKSVHPDREVVCIAGDGDYLMTGQEIATAVQYGINAVVVVVDNGTYGTIRMHQEMHYPGAPRTIATDLKNPDFVQYAEAFGAFGIRCERTEDFPAALAAARNAGRPAIVHLITSAEDIAPGRTISGLRSR
ncbi:thiamine pyrophosphate-binding protein [Brevundimonas basaltis]|uniref:Acetolactate synthase-1/2/3 large subunit n=1 Tax=Brevundimonas basaltis TaxID=472166 RepID=A0A7W8HZK1_9CAUL|nr:thiamine pyrophosphate-binding protein [Brevundimonas basaltis]MBB5291842.1 acetolactate synthase-1/2/3 large subunit [Brevundimonas basaltis]